MPLTQISKQIGEVNLGFWQLDESVQELLSIIEVQPHELENFTQLKHEKVKKQWLSARILARSLCGEGASIYYDEYGKPHCHNSAGISISHSGKYVLLATNPNGPIGVDIEQISEKIIRVKDKFISLEEEALLEPIGNEKLFIFYHLIWSFKEAAYKLYGKKGLVFKKHVILRELDKLELNTINGVLIINHKEVEITGSFLFIDGYVICTCRYK